MLEFIHSLEVMSKLCNDKFYYDVSIDSKNVITLMIYEDDDILYTDNFEFLIFEYSIVFIYNIYYDVNKSKTSKSRQNFIIKYIDRIRKALNFSDFDDREKVIKGKL